MNSFPLIHLFSLCAISWSIVYGDDSEFSISPAAINLHAEEDSQQVVVTGNASEVDLTRTVRYEIADPAIASVSDSGRVSPVAPGSTTLRVIHGKGLQSIPVHIGNLTSPRPVSFRFDVLPILTKAGCNSGGCHGKAEGQNGFKLSIFGFDADADHDALVSEGRGRRVHLSAPEHSILLRKATAEMPHGGGARIAKDSVWYQRLRRWIAEGARDAPAPDSEVTAINVFPAEVEMLPGTSQQLQVTAITAGGSQRCVTVEAEYQSNAEDIATADRDGLITVSEVPGEAAILVRYMGHVGICRVTLPRKGSEFPRPPEQNFVDAAVWDRLQKLGIPPSSHSDDAVFLRRVYLDLIGTLPTESECRTFLGDTSPTKRDALIRTLMDRPEYADYHALRWADILRVDKSIVTPQGAVAMTRWLKTQLRENVPYDRMVHDLVTSQGNTLTESPNAFFQVHKDPGMLGRSVSQVFLGVRIGCAECHHHPFERWSQTDYYAFAGFFTGVGRKGVPSGGQKIFPQPGKELTHPRTGEAVAPAGLGAPSPDLSEDYDRRKKLADWMVSKENPWFARMIVNRLWAHYFGRGLVEPIDDLRATNPATNEPLMNALASHLTEHDYDIRQLTFTMLSSRTYQLSARTLPENESDSQNYSHAAWRPLPAEVLLDANCQATGVAEQFNGWPEGYRAIQVWDNRMPSYFFKVFGRPQRVSVCECERGNEPSISQALHLMNSPESVRRIRHRDGVCAQLAASNDEPQKIIERLYLRTLSRFPAPRETQLMLQAFEQSRTRRQAVEDIMWALLNTREFVFNH